MAKLLLSVPLLPPSPPPPPLRARPWRSVSRFLILSVAGSVALFYALLSLVPACMVGGHPQCYHGYQSRFSFDADQSPDHPAWMAAIPDSVALTSLSIPGTHDTMTYAMSSDQTLQCQNANLTAQLEAGVRYLDIRARLMRDSGELHVYHGDGYTGFSFEDVLLDVFAFLDRNPSEAIIMRLKEEGPPLRNNNNINENNSKNISTFEDAFNYARLASPSTSPGALKHLHPHDPLAPLPALGTLRSRVLILQDFSAHPSSPPYGPAWDGPLMALEDFWIVVDIYHLADKWTAIREALEAAAQAPLDNTVLFAAHVSASVGVLPVEAAAGPLNRTVVGMNDMTGQWVEDFAAVEGVTRTGVVIFDFPGQRAIQAVLDWNKRYATESWGRQQKGGTYGNVIRAQDA